MSSQERICIDNPTGLQELQSLESPLDTTSEISSGFDEGIFGDVKDRRKRQSQSKSTTGEDTTPSLVDTVLTEADATDISSDIGRYWRPLGRKLKLPETVLENILDDKSNHSNEDKAHFLLIKYIRQYGCDATKGRLAEALVTIGRRDVAEILIGKEYFASKTADKPIFFLKEESSFNVPDEDGQDTRFFTCRSIEDGQLYLVRKMDEAGYEESCKTLKQNDTIADYILKALDVKGIVKAEKRKKEMQKFTEAQEKIVKLLNGLQEIASSLENQERKEKRIQLWKQLLEDETLLANMQTLGTGLLRITTDVSQLEDPFPLEAQMYSICLGLSASLRDLEERVKMLREMVPRGKKLLDKIETEKFDQLLKKSHSLGKEIKMKEKYFIKRFKEFSVENQKRPRTGQDCSSSDPTPSTNKYPLDFPEVRRGRSQPGCENDHKILRKEVAPPPDPMEEGSFQPSCENDLKILREQVAPPPDPTEQDDEYSVC